MRINSYKNNRQDRLRVMQNNPKVFSNMNAVIQKFGDVPNRMLLDVGQPMPMADFGAYMANTRTHKRNNKR